MGKNDRLGNIELLRVLSMLMIISLHFLGHGGVLQGVWPYSFKYYICWILEGICYVSVNCYVLISGYFLAESKFKLNRLLYLLIEVFFFSMCIYLLLLSTGRAAFSVQGFLTALLPTISGEYWFVTMYVGMYIISPFINILLKNMSQLQHIILIVLLVLLFSILPTLFFYSEGLNFGGGMGVVWFTVLYVIAAYLRKFYIVKNYKAQIFIAYILITLSVPLSFFGLDFVAKKFSIEFLLQGATNMMYSYNSIGVCLSSVLLFILFLNINITMNKKILFLSSQTFGVYLLHDNPHIRTILWGKINFEQYLVKGNFEFFANAFIVIIAIFLSGTIISYIMHKILALLPMTKLFKIIETKMDICVKKINAVFIENI